MIVVVATEKEKNLAEKRFPGKKIIRTGIGALNVIEALKDVPVTEPILNFGYAGSNHLPIGREVTVKDCRLYHPHVIYHEKEYHLGGDVDCYTSTDFVTSTTIQDEALVFDMELAFILALGFTDVKSIKIVSDNLSLKQYEETVER